MQNPNLQSKLTESNAQGPKNIETKKCRRKTLTKFWDSEPIQPAIYTVLHAESESEVKKDKNLQPGGDIRKTKVYRNFLVNPYLLIFSYFPFWGAVRWTGGDESWSVFHAESESAVRIDRFLHREGKIKKNRPTRVSISYRKISYCMSPPYFRIPDLSSRLCVQFCMQNPNLRSKKPKIYSQGRQFRKTEIYRNFLINPYFLIFLMNSFKGPDQDFNSFKSLGLSRQWPGIHISTNSYLLVY